MCGQANQDFYATDLISDILSNGKSARLYQNLVEKQKLFSEIHAYITGEIDPGLFIITGNLNPSVSMESAEKAIYSEIQKIKEGFVFDYELQKVKNKFESSAVLDEIDVLSKAKTLAYYANLGDVNLANNRLKKYAEVSLVDVKRVSDKLFDEKNDSTVYYLAK